jgi:hypothetical protein
VSSAVEYVSSGSDGQIHHMPVLNLFEAQRFIDTVYSPHLTGALSVVSTGDWTGKPFARSQTKELLSYVRTLDAQGKPGIYLRATTSKFNLQIGRRGESIDALELPGLWADLDFGTAGHAEKRHLPHPPDEYAAASLIEIAGLPSPTLWVHSGGGLYAWWLLHEPFLIPDDNARTYLDTLSRKWQHVIAKAAASRGWYYGTESSDLARVLRLPGTVNRKVTGRDRPCFIASDGGPRYLLQDFHNAVEPLVAKWGVDLTAVATYGKASAFETSSFYSTLVNPDGEPCKFMAIVRDRWINVIQQAGASCHDEGVKAALAIAMEGANRHHGANTAMRQLQEVFLSIRVPGAASGIVVEDSGQEWNRLEAGAWRRAAARAAQPGDPLLKEKDYCHCFEPFEPTVVAPVTPQPNFLSPGGQPTAATTEPRSFNTNLPQHFWDSRPVLKHIQNAAHMRSRSADAVLGAVLARLSAILPGDLRVDTSTATACSLNFFSVLLGPPGSGKSTSASLAESLFPMGYDHSCRRHNIGSGQGIAAAYGSVVEGEFQQSETKALFACDEGSVLLKIAKERGNSTLDTLRTAWTGGEIGQKNAAAERDRRVRNYSLGFWVGLQPIHAVQLLSDENVGDGTFQRFVWFSTVDPNIPPIDAMPINHMIDPMPFDLATAWAQDPVLIPENIKYECRLRDSATSRGDVEITPSQEHALLRQVKIACLLSILDSRRYVTDEDWHLAKVMLDTSDAVADSVRQDASKRRARREQARAVSSIQAKMQELDALDQREEERVEKIVIRAVEKVRERPGIRRGTLKCSLSRDRELADLAIERAIDRGLLRSEVTENGQGELLRPS